MRHAGTTTPLFAVSPAWEQEFHFPSMTFHMAHAFDIICQLDRDDTLDEVPQYKKQKAATGLLLDKLHKQDLAGPLACCASRVLGPISRHRVADILLHMKIVSHASRPGCLLVSFASCVLDCALHGDFALQRMITPAVLDVQMSLTLSLITMSVPSCITSLFHSGDMLQYCHQETTCYTT